MLYRQKENNEYQKHSTDSQVTTQDPVLINGYTKEDFKIIEIENIIPTTREKSIENMYHTHPQVKVRKCTPIGQHSRGKQFFS